MLAVAKPSSGNGLSDKTLKTTQYKVIKVIVPHGYSGGLKLINSQGKPVQVEVENTGDGVYYIRINKDVVGDRYYLQPENNQIPASKPLVVI
jgi:hypothetical protein